MRALENALAILFTGCIMERMGANNSQLQLCHGVNYSAVSKILPGGFVAQGRGQSSLTAQV